jgi:hypothetical protein
MEEPPGGTAEGGGPDDPGPAPQLLTDLPDGVLELIAGRLVWVPG